MSLYVAYANGKAGRVAQMAYGHFDGWRRMLAGLVDIDLDEMHGFEGNRPWCTLPSDALHILLSHCDCEGTISWRLCGPLADRLEELLPRITGGDKNNPNLLWQDVTRQWIKGLRRAAAAKKDVEFM